MATEIEYNNRLDEFKKKRNLILFFVFISFAFLATSFALLYFLFHVNFDILQTIYLVLAVIYLGLILYIKNKLSFYQMNIQYLEMLTNEGGPIRIKDRIFTPSWIQKIKDEGFILAADNQDFSLYYQFNSKLKWIVNSGDVFLCIVIAKHEGFSFYNGEVDNEIQLIQHKEPKKFRTSKQIVLQFKRYEKLTENEINEITQIIHFKNNRQYLIHLTIGYIFEKSMIYFLYPKHKYPNKYYYFAGRYIQYLCGINVEE